MNSTAQRLKRLYDAGRINDAALANAVSCGILTQEDYNEIVGVNTEDVL